MTDRLEGRVSVLAALEARQRTIEVVLLSRAAKPEKVAEVLEGARRCGVPVRQVEEAELGAQAKTHGGVVAVCGPKPLLSAAELYRKVDALREAPFVLLLEGADDSRNLGYVLRTAEAFGAHAVLLRRRAFDVDATAVSRASSGAFERLSIGLVERELDEVGQLRKRGLKLVGCIPRARTSIYEAKLAEPLVLAIGGEKRGLSGAVRSRCDVLVRIPTRPGPSSLSMTQAAAVAMSEVARQRGGR
ncbi:MAG: RNA methyltransferase [Planctomycetes bacterium]|nr:RNA methyltransferase [Planctomycetota bacterium]